MALESNELFSQRSFGNRPNGCHFEPQLRQDHRRRKSLCVQSGIAIYVF